MRSRRSIIFLSHDFNGCDRYYTTISSPEQRRRYKAEFNADYEEYKRLHAQMAMVSGRFKQLEERLKEEEAMGNVEGCKVNNMKNFPMKPKGRTGEGRGLMGRQR